MGTAFSIELPEPNKRFKTSEEFEKELFELEKERYEGKWWPSCPHCKKKMRLAYGSCYFWACDCSQKELERFFNHLMEA